MVRLLPAVCKLRRRPSLRVARGFYASLWSAAARHRISTRGINHSLLKRGVYGTFHKVSIKHLGRHCNEFSFRFNRRGEQLQMFAMRPSRAS
jgi:hypothetical protein